MMTTTFGAAQLSLNMGARSGVETDEPYAGGDVVVTHRGVRVVVTLVDENAEGAVLLGVRLDNGAECVVLQREVAYRSQWKTHAR